MFEEAVATTPATRAMLTVAPVRRAFGSPVAVGAAEVLEAFVDVTILLLHSFIQRELRAAQKSLRKGLRA